MYKQNIGDSMRVKIKKWGNSLALRIPKAFADQSKIYENEFVDISLENNRIFIEPLELRDYSLKEMSSAINKLNVHKEMDFGKIEGKELW